MTKHLEDRCEDRHISSLTVEMLLRYGESVPVAGGAAIRILTRKQRKKLLNELRHAQKNLSSIDPPYLVQGRDGEIITAGRRHKHIRRK